MLATNWKFGLSIGFARGTSRMQICGKISWRAPKNVHIPLLACRAQKRARNAHILKRRG